MHRDTIQVYKKSSNFWNHTLYKAGDSIYTINELRPIIKQDEKAYRSYKSYQINNILAGGFSLMTVACIIKLGRDLIDKKNVFPNIGAVVVGVLLTETFKKATRKTLNKTIRRYNNSF